MYNFIARLHLVYLLLKLKVTTTWKKLWSKAKPVVAPIIAKETPVVKADIVKAEANPNVVQVEGFVKSHRKLVDIALSLVISLIGGVVAHDHMHKAPAAKAVVAVSAKAPEAYVGLVRVSELTPDGQVFLATTVPASAIVSATDAGITWHPTAQVTETWHGSYRISK